MANKVMQIEVYDDGTIQVLDSTKTEAAGKPIEAEETNWKKFHGYLKKNDAKHSVAEEQITIIVTNPCVWVKVGSVWKCICW